MNGTIKTTFSIPIEIRDRVYKLTKECDVGEPDTLSKFYLVAVMEKLERDTNGEVTEKVRTIKENLAKGKPEKGRFLQEFRKQQQGWKQ